MSKRTAITASAVAMAGLLAACTGYQPPPFPLPDEPGFYALSANDELQRIDGDRSWEVETWPERANLSPYTEFVIYDPILARDSRPREQLIDIWRVAWVRSEIDGTGAAGPIQGSAWAVAAISPFRMPVTFEHVQGRPEFVHVMPQQPLDPGLYSLRLNKVGVSRVARVGIEWGSVDKRSYSAANCVDRYLQAEPRYRTCSGGGGDVMEAAVPEGLEVTLVDPLRRDGALVVQGVVINTSEGTKRVPHMQAVLLDKQGNRLTHALIEPSASDLRPGERMSFKTEIPNAPRTTARVDVVFVPTSKAGM